MNKVRFSIRLKLVLLSITILLIFGLASMISVYTLIKQSNLSSMDQALNSTSSLLAERVNLEELMVLLGQSESSKLMAKNFSQRMDAIIAEQSQIANLYIVTFKNGKSYFSTMSSSLLSDTLQFGSEYSDGGVFDLAAKESFDNNSTRTTDVFTDQFGTWKSGVAPIVDQNGKVIALYGVDFDVSKTTEKAWNEAKQLLLLIVLFLVISSIIVYFFVTRMMKPLSHLSGMSLRIAAGDLTVEELKVKSNDEIGLLSYNFNQMVDNLRSLIQQVGQSAEVVAASSEELLATTEQATQATNHISSAIQEVASGAETQVTSSQGKFKGDGGSIHRDSTNCGILSYGI